MHSQSDAIMANILVADQNQTCTVQCALQLPPQDCRSALHLPPQWLQEWNGCIALCGLILSAFIQNAFAELVIKTVHVPWKMYKYKSWALLSTESNYIRAIAHSHYYFTPITIINTVQSCVKSFLLSWENFCQSFRKWQMGRRRQASPPWQHWGGKIQTCRNNFTHRCIYKLFPNQVW